MTKTILSIFALYFTTSIVLAGGSKPNIVFVYFDDMGYGDVSCLNPESKIQTPNIDRMAAQGMTLPMPMLHRRFALPVAMGC